MKIIFLYLVELTPEFSCLRPGHSHGQKVGFVDEFQLVNVIDLELLHYVVKFAVHSGLGVRTFYVKCVMDMG